MKASWQRERERVEIVAMYSIYVFSPVLEEEEEEEEDTVSMVRAGSPWQWRRR